MAGDIEEFLRRAAQRRAPQPPPASPPPQPTRQVQMLDDADVVDADVVEAYPVEDPGILTGHDVGAHVAQHIDTADFGERISHLGEVVDNADDRMEAHIHGFFEHKLGDLGAHTSRAADSTLDDDSPSQGGPADKQKIPAFNIQRLLSSPASIRDAIILSEVLRKPEF